MGSDEPPITEASWVVGCLLVAAVIVILRMLLV